MQDDLADGGDSWNKLTHGLPKADMGRIGLAVSPARPDVVYAIVEAERDEGGFFRSTDAGGNWTRQGDYVSGSRVIGEASKTALREVLDEIQSGEFAKKWIEEARSGAPNFKRRRKEERGHILETTGDALRARMSWL